MILNALGEVILDVRKYMDTNKHTQKYNQFMIDIETTGVKPDLNHIIEIAIVPFGMTNNVMFISPLEYHMLFKLNHNQGYRDYDAQTLIWWDKQSKEIRESVFSHFFDDSLNNPKTLLELTKFITYLSRADTQFWSKPNSFDFMFLQSLFSDFKIIFPFNYWIAKDMAGFCSGLSFVHQKTLDYRVYKPLKREGAHSSMDDCYYQLEWLENAISNNSTEEPLPF